MWELDHKESRAQKNWCFWSVVLEKTLENSLNCTEIRPVGPNGNQSWIFTGRTDAEAEAPILWSPDGKIGLIGKDPDAVKDWRQEKGRTRWDAWMASPTWWAWVWASSSSWCWTGKLGMLQSWGHKELDVTEHLNGINYIGPTDNWGKFPILNQLFSKLNGPEKSTCHVI